MAAMARNSDRLAQQLNTVTTGKVGVLVRPTEDQSHTQTRAELERALTGMDRTRHHFNVTVDEMGHGWVILKGEDLHELAQGAAQMGDVFATAGLGDRVVAAVLAQPSGFNPEAPRIYYENNMKNWGPALCARGDISMDDVEAFLTETYLNRGDFVFTADREFVRSCQTPVLVMPDDIPAHPFAMAMETAELAPNSQVSLFPWKEPESHIPIAVRHVRSFLKAHAPTSE